MRRKAALAAVAAVTTASAPALAVEREHQIGVDLGMPVAFAIQGSSVATGASFGLHYSYGLNDALNLVASGGTSLLAPGSSSSLTVSNVDVGVGYVLDVLRWIPWGSAELGGYALTGGTGTQITPGFAVAVGLDYRIDRSWAVGFMLREHMVLADTSPSPSFAPGFLNYPSYTQGLLRLQYTWGW